MKHLDTNILIGISKRDPNILATLSNLLENAIDFGVSSISWREFCNGVQNKSEINSIYHLISGNCSAFSMKEAELATKLYLNTGENKKHIPDCMIAATAISHNATLLTQNLKDFKPFTKFGLKLEAVPTV